MNNYSNDDNMFNAVKKLRRKTCRRWYLRLKFFGKKIAKRIARQQCSSTTELLIRIHVCETIDDIKSITIDEIDHAVEEEIMCCLY